MKMHYIFWVNLIGAILSEGKNIFGILVHSNTIYDNLPSSFLQNYLKNFYEKWSSQ